MAFLDKVLGRDERETKLKQEISSLELRKESVFSSIDGEIARLRRECNNVLLEAGTTAYDAWVKGDTQANLVEFWNKVQELEKLIAEQEAKRVEMGTRYDEEIQLINNSFGISSAVGAAIADNAAQCPKCKAAISADDTFCQNCGEKVK